MSPAGRCGGKKPGGAWSRVRRLGRTLTKEVIQWLIHVTVWEGCTFKSAPDG